MSDVVTNILTASVYDVANRTPLQRADRLSRTLHTNVHLKREDMQPVFSFKIRGAYNKIKNLSKAEKAKGIIAASAGNHAQGVALSAQRLGIKATIVMPTTTPQIKVDAVKNYGAQIVLYGDNYSEAQAHCDALAKKTKATFVHPYDDPLVIAGQGTIGKEILEQLPHVTHIFVPVGGGGLIAGIAAYVKSIAPGVKIVGVEPEDAATLHQSLKKKRRISLDHVGIFADGVAVKQLGKETFKLAKKYIDTTVTVNNDQLCAAIKQIFEETRTIVEPAGALAVAGIEAYATKHTLDKNSHLVAINSGANISFERLQYVTERTLIGSGKEALFSVELPETPGALEGFCEQLGKHNISEFNYRQSSASKAHILVGITTHTQSDAKSLASRLTKSGFKTTDFTTNELAKEHIRHMVGGKLGPEDEILAHFNFPERPGALAQFLKTLGRKWNISLFHYRGMGSDNGRVLIGFDVPPKDSVRFQKFLKKTGFDYELETNNQAYRTFLH